VNEKKTRDLERTKAACWKGNFFVVGCKIFIRKLTPDLPTLNEFKASLTICQTTMQGAEVRFNQPANIIKQG
jgi:hypothetical protein